MFTREIHRHQFVGKREGTDDAAYGESASLGNLAADALLVAAGKNTQLALTNSGGIRKMCIRDRRYVARFDANGKARVGVEAVREDHPLASLLPCDNVFAIESLSLIHISF